MSLPRSIPTDSTSPTKSVLRRTTGLQTPSSRSLLPSPHFEHDRSPELQQSPQARDLDHDQPIEEEDETEIGAGNPPFQPFFTLIEDGVANEHYHPTVHYIFADDDADIVTEAACRSLQHLDPLQHPATSLSNDASNVDAEEESRLPQQVPGIREHYLILDVQPTETQVEGQPKASYAVVKAQSLSSEWQILRTNITSAPTIGEGEEDENLMLRIEGRGNTPLEAEKDDVREKESLEEMIEKFQKRLGDIRQLMDIPTVTG